MKELYLININGEIQNGEEAKISVFDRGFLYGDSVYESTRTFDQIPFRIHKHLDRLFQSAEKISLIPTYSKENILNEVLRTIKASPCSNLLLRIVLTRGTNDDLGLAPDLSGPNNLIIYAKEIKNNPTSWLSEGVHLTFYQKETENFGSLPKTGNYQENIMAYQKAQSLGFFDSLMVNTLGLVTEGSTSNVWIIKDGQLYTPPLSDGVLDGLTRKALFEMQEAGKLPLPLVEKSLSPLEVKQCDECFLTSTTRNLVPVTQLDNSPVGKGKAGAMTLKLLSLYLDFVKQTN